MFNVSGLEAKSYRITPEGIDELKHELENLRQQRKEVADEMREIASQSTDLGSREDSAMAIEQNKATELDGQIVLLERIIGFADVIDPPADTGTVQFGSWVTLTLDGAESKYRLVGPVEADPSEGKISGESPLGKSLLGKRVGEMCEITLPTGQRAQAAIRAIA